MQTAGRSMPVRARMAGLATLLVLSAQAVAACELIVSNWQLGFGNLWAGSSRPVFATASAPSVRIQGIGSCKKDGVMLRILPTRNQASCGRPCLRSHADTWVAYEVGFGSEMKQVLSVDTSAYGPVPTVTARIPAGALRQAYPGAYSDMVYIEVNL